MFIQYRSPLYLRQALAIGERCRFSSPAVALAAEIAPKPRHTVQKTSYPILSIHSILNEVRAASWAKFDETLEVSINTGLDPRKPNQSVKGVARLPFGTGKKTRIAVVATGSDIQAALDAGADIVGLEEVLALLQGGDVAFDVVIATPDTMPAVSKLGRVSESSRSVIRCN